MSTIQWYAKLYQPINSSHVYVTWFLNEIVNSLVYTKILSGANHQPPATPKSMECVVVCVKDHQSRPPRPSLVRSIKAKVQAKHLQS